jgi:hypothetical protein
MVAGTEPKGLLEVPVSRLGEVADPAPATAPRAGGGDRQSPIPTSVAGPRAARGGSLSSKSAGAFPDCLAAPSRSCLLD